MPVDVLIGLGSNAGDRLANLKFGLRKLQELANLVAVSSVYETEPWGREEQPQFLNQVCRLTTDTSDPHAFLQHLKTIETDAGREVSHQIWGPRPLDLDILFWGGLVIKRETLTVPHPLIPDRRFVLVPLTEIANDLMHPELKLTIGELLKQCLDDKKVVKRSDLRIEL